MGGREGCNAAQSLHLAFHRGSACVCVHVRLCHDANVRSHGSVKWRSVKVGVKGGKKHKK